MCSLSVGDDDIVTCLIHRKKQTPFLADNIARCSENILSRGTCSCSCWEGRSVWSRSAWGKRNHLTQTRCVSEHPQASMTELHAQVTAVVSLKTRRTSWGKNLTLTFSSTNRLSSVQLSSMSVLELASTSGIAVYFPASNFKSAGGHLFQTLENFFGFQRLIDDNGEEFESDFWQELENMGCEATSTTVTIPENAVGKRHGRIWNTPAQQTDPLSRCFRTLCLFEDAQDSRSRTVLTLLQSCTYCTRAVSSYSKRFCQRVIRVMSKTSVNDSKVRTQSSLFLGRQSWLRLLSSWTHVGGSSCRMYSLKAALSVFVITLLATRWGPHLLCYEHRRSSSSCTSWQRVPFLDSAFLASPRLFTSVVTELVIPTTQTSWSRSNVCLSASSCGKQIHRTRHIWGHAETGRLCRDVTDRRDKRNVQFSSTRNSSIDTSHWTCSVLPETWCSAALDVFARARSHCFMCDRVGLWVGFIAKSSNSLSSLCCFTGASGTRHVPWRIRSCISCTSRQGTDVREQDVWSERFFVVMILTLCAEHWSFHHRSRASFSCSRCDLKQRSYAFLCVLEFHVCPVTLCLRRKWRRRCHMFSQK